MSSVSLAEFFKDYGALLGPFLAVIPIYAKLFIDAHFLRKTARKQIDKVIKLIKESPPPEWIKTYESEQNLKEITEATSRNTYHLGHFKRRMVAVTALIDEVVKDVYKNSKEDDVILISNLRERCKLILESIEKDSKEYKELSLEFDEEYKKYKEALKLNKNMEVPKNLRDVQHKIECKRMFTNVLFLELRFLYNHLLEIIHDEDSVFNKVGYKYDV